MLALDDHDSTLVRTVVEALRQALSNAHSRSGVIKRIVTVAVRERNQGRAAAIRRHPFRGTCEATGLPLDRRDAVLDEEEPERGYEGAVRWVCPRCNNSGRRSCRDAA